MRAVAKILRTRASEHPCNFCEQFEQSPNFASTFILNGTIRYPLHSIQDMFSAMIIENAAAFSEEIRNDIFPPQFSLLFPLVYLDIIRRWVYYETIITALHCARSCRFKITWRQ